MSVKNVETTGGRGNCSSSIQNCKVENDEREGRVNDSVERDSDMEFQENCNTGKEKNTTKRTAGNNKRSKATNLKSSCLNVKMVPPPKKNRAAEDELDDTKIDNVHGIVESDLSLLDELDGEMEPQVSQLLNKLSSQIQHRVRAKKQRLDQNFQAVYSIPARILTLQNEQRSSRERMISEFKEAIGSINEKLNEVVQLQLRNEEKQTKLAMTLSRESDEMKKLISECNDLQRTAFGKFVSSDKNLTKQMESEAVQDTEQNNKIITFLQKKLLADGQKEGSEALYNLHRFI